jgi:hypothetical protein
MEKLTVDLGSRSYPILIGDGLIRDIGRACRTAAEAAAHDDRHRQPMSPNII